MKNTLAILALSASLCACGSHVYETGFDPADQPGRSMQLTEICWWSDVSNYVVPIPTVLNPENTLLGIDQL